MILIMRDLHRYVGGTIVMSDDYHVDNDHNDHDDSNDDDHDDSDEDELDDSVDDACDDSDNYDHGNDHVSDDYHHLSVDDNNHLWE